jgi:hypothetical protein
VIAFAHVRTGLGLLGLVIALGAGLARAQAPARASTIAIEQAIDVDPGATCLDARRLGAHVRTWLGRSRVAADLRVRVQGDPRSARRVEFELVRGASRGRREFDPTPEGCDETHAVVGLAIALAIDAELLAGLVQPEPPSEPWPPFALLTFELGGGYDVLPEFSLGARAGVELGLLDWLSARAELFAEHAPGIRIAPSPGTFDATLFAGDLRVCAGGALVRPLRIALCGGPAAGAVHARGRDFASSYAPTGAWFGIISGLRLAWTPGVTLVLDVDMAVPLRAPAFRVDRSQDEDLRREPSTAGLMLRLGVGLPL